MQIETKFNVNQKVFCVERERRIIRKPCNICNGSGTVTLKCKEYKCPECSGRGCGEYRNVYVVHEAVINRIRIGIKEKVTISYRCIYDRDKDLPIKEKNKETSIAEYENRIFGTYEEAEYYCKGLNNKKISVFDFMIIEEFAKKIEISPAEIIKWLSLRGKVVDSESLICYEDIREFADEYGFICEKEVRKLKDV